jgi:hypothetical protein
MIGTVIGGHLIREARRRAGMSQAELARALGTHQSVVGRWESGRTRPDFDVVVAAVRATGHDLGISVVAGDDQSVALIRRELALPPHERLAAMVRAVRAFDEMVAAARG